ncbi:sulfite exporter TauE/SafE family protein [Parasedimentitalea psychrophila]|uniref:Probable membrane transporter protein n=1 Tax=Parasedimentitalea psychrophila TaxID=2997337 RepID=A0A9Y2P2B7_9RHOB|nr:sulfite exporter TauE/SafE family protein [Parasedimentitalea psychrophila]WIY24917.1 sulfite exporter TauE/SafE family protein [Parasedimentitalea psychrophila]
MIDLVVLITAAFLAGGLNAIAGGGSFLTFPALVFTGVAPIAANATSAVAVFPGYASGALGFLSELRRFDRRVLIRLLGLSVLGGVSGSLLLLVTPATVFNWVVPWLLLFATILFLLGGRINSWIEARGRAESNSWLPTLLVSIYGGYFNGGLGIVLLALFSAQGMRDLNLMNGLKNLLSFLLSAASVVTFTLAGIVHWYEAGFMMVAATIGGYFGARVARRLPVAMIKAIVVLVGLVMTTVFFARSLA